MQEIIKNNKNNKIVREAVIEFYENQEKFKSIKETYEKRREELQCVIRKYIDDEGLKYFRFLADSGVFKNANSILKVNNVKQKKVNFDIPKLKKSISKETFNKIVKKEYKIDDMEGLIDYLKKCGVNPKVFKSFLIITETVDQNVVNELGESGELKLEDLKGCYEVSENVGYIKITEES